MLEDFSSDRVVLASFVHQSVAARDLAPKSSSSPSSLKRRALLTPVGPALSQYYWYTILYLGNAGLSLSDHYLSFRGLPLLSSVHANASLKRREGLEE